MIVKIRRLFSPNISEPLTWSLKDFKRAKRWAHSRLHPNDKKRTIWEVVYSHRRESVDIINQINQMILIENKTNK